MSPPRTLHSLDELVALADSRDDLYVRWTDDPQEDRQRGGSIDELTGVEMPGLSANPLKVEPWWEDRPHHLWMARRLYDYRHLREQRGPEVRPWLIVGDVVGRGPDNEPLVRCREIVACLDDSVTTAATKLIDAQPHDWGSLDRK
jgi:hypothetical protein